MTKSQILFYLCLLYIAGVWVYSLVESSQPFLFEPIGQEITFKGIIISEPEQRINQQKFQVETDGIEGKILITAELYPKYQYGDELEISGKLQEPAVFEDFDYQEYLRKDGIYSVVYYPSIQRLAENQGHWFYQKIFNFKNKLGNIIDQTLLPPQSNILRAFFLGDESGLSAQLKENLNITGTRHIIAVSGTHMIIMTQILLSFGLALGLWRQQIFYFVLIILIIYIIMIGAPASAVRAGIMAGLLLLAQKAGRLRSASRAVIFAATAMLVFNPLLLKSDVGFQLSFLAVLGIIYFNPILDDKMARWPNPFYLKDVLIMTFSAQIATLPISIFHFSRLSLISPLTNLLIVPLSSLIMISGMVLTFSGLIWLPLAKIIAGPIWFLLTYIIKTVDLSSLLPLAAVEIGSISWVILVGYYLALMFFVWSWQRQKAIKEDGKNV